jgi:hypothetical protein
MAAMPKNRRRSVLQADGISYSQLTRYPEKGTYMQSRGHHNAHCTKV